ncbi:MAG TPA: OmpA family protein [Bryobacteraceae bacterium]|nr:OmpA family protein [Bryobacteraceae bacterium]
MADSLLTSLFGMLDSRSISGIAGALGAPDHSVLQGLKSSIACVLGGMASKSEDPGALRNILDLTPSAAGDGAMSQIARAASDANSPLISGGKRILSSLFGNSEPTVMNAVGSASGLRASATSTILAMVAPMVMGFLSKRVRTEGMNMNSFGGLLQRERDSIESALPPGVKDVIWPPAVKTVSATPVVAQTVTREPSTSYRWLPLLALALLIPVLAWMLHHARRPIVVHIPPVAAQRLPQRTPLGTASRSATDSIDTVKRALSDADLRFDTGSARLRPESQATLNSIAATLQRFPDVNLRVAGHTDNVGNPERNLELSQRRADTVVAELTAKGISTGRLSARGYGDENPIDSNSTAAGRARNRRVSLDIW